MSSSRDAPFSFSPDLRSSLGPPDRLNVVVRTAFPALFDRDRGPSRAALPFSSEFAGSGVAVRPGAVIPAGAEVGLFTGHVFSGPGARGAHIVEIPSFNVHGVELRLVVDGTARASRYPSAAEAALYGHACTDPTVLGTWWMDGPVPCLVARTTRRLQQGDWLVWDRDAHASGGYTSSHAEARAWRRAGHRTARCACNAPRDCLRDRFLCLADSPAASDDSD
jgi:hypothetical protein